VLGNKTNSYYEILLRVLKALQSTHSFRGHTYTSGQPSLVCVSPTIIQRHHITDPTCKKPVPLILTGTLLKLVKEKERKTDKLRPAWKRPTKQRRNLHSSDFDGFVTNLLLIHYNAFSDMTWNCCVSGRASSLCKKVNDKVLAWLS